MTRITFGIIALNAHPFLMYNLRTLYPFAHQIIVVEGATEAAVSLARPDGHSTDGTFEALEEFRDQEDPENKVLIVSASEEGFVTGIWPEKDEMSRAYAKRTTGDWLWQVDSDEFYFSADLERIQHILQEVRDLEGISFPFYEFWGGFDYVVTGVWYLHEFTEVRRIFRWKSGYSYLSHRPPTVGDESGMPLSLSKSLDGNRMRRLGIFMHHYSYVFPKQATQKVGYYSNVDWTSAFRQNDRWLEENYSKLKHPMFIGERDSVLQWLERYKGKHPDAIVKLRQDLAKGKIVEAMRSTEDIEHLLSSPLYFLQRVAARVLLKAFWPLRGFWKKVRLVLLGNKPLSE